MTEQLLLLAIGAIAGTLAGLLGIGGGIIVVPSLEALFNAQFPHPLVIHMAVGTSLAIMVFTAFSAAYAYQKRGLIEWPLVYKFIPGLLLGMIVGSTITRSLSGSLLSMAFGMFLLIVSANMFFSKKPKAVERELPSFLILSLIAFLIGFCSGTFGIGGGTMMVPFFIYCHVEVHKAAGTTAFCGVPLALTGTLMLTLTGSGAISAYSVPSGTTGYVYWPAVALIACTSLLCAPLGTRLAVLLPGQLIKKIFSIILFLTALNLITNRV